MADVFSREKRSLVMSRIRGSKNKSTELALISIFKEYGIKDWRRKSTIFGKPDFVFPKSKIAVFVDGCFCHGHECQKGMPQTNKFFWVSKITRNKERDAEVSAYLSSKGWRVLRVWECEFKKKNRSLLLEKLKPLFPV
jgi:DNA mismatch endonuclease (patch repair protein)